MSIIVGTFNIKLSPVKQELNNRFQPNEIKIVYDFYSVYTQSNKKISKIKEFIKFIDYCIQKYGKVLLLNSIYILYNKYQSGTLHKSKVNLRYLEGIIKNNRSSDSLSNILVKELQQKKCNICGTLLVNNLCPVCGS
jgi:hypothetical protein